MLSALEAETDSLFAMLPARLVEWLWETLATSTSSSEEETDWDTMMLVLLEALKEAATETLVLMEPFTLVVTESWAIFSEVAFEAALSLMLALVNWLSKTLVSRLSTTLPTAEARLLLLREALSEVLADVSWLKESILLLLTDLLSDMLWSSSKAWLFTAERLSEAFWLASLLILATRLADSDWLCTTLSPYSLIALEAEVEAEAAETEFSVLRDRLETTLPMRLALMLSTRFLREAWEAAS